MWPINPLATTTVWIAATESSTRNGCLRVIPGSHAAQRMFDGYTIHGAAHNRGTVPRAGYALRFMPATSHFDHDGAERRDEPGYAHNTRALLLVRGKDRSGRNDFTRGHPQGGAAF